MVCHSKNWLLLAVLLWPHTAPAQRLTGEIRLSVQDPSGAAVMSATGKLESLPGGVVRRFRTDAQGAFTFSGIPLGRYRLEVSKEGFASQTTLIEVPSEAPVSQSIALELSALASKVEVVATTPLSVGDLTLDEIPAPVQSVTSKDLEQAGALNLSELLHRRLNGVYLNEVQNNPYQPDLNYRGYSASPLLGTPEGVSVYMDGVRLNQPFGDVVSWDLIPTAAIAEATMIPGSNPLFGLNALGGAMSIQTKDGRSQPGTSIEATGGSYGRRAIEVEHGGSTAKGLNWYFAGNLFHEDGWRVASPSDVRQAFGKLGWQNARTSLGLTAAYADNALNGNGLQEQRFIAQNYSSAYTIPDVTHNRSPFLNFTVRHSPSSAVTISGNAYFRYIRTDTFNADLNNDSLDESVYQPTAADQAALAAAGYTGFPTSGANASNTPFPFWRCIAQALQKDEPDEKCNGLLTSAYTKQHNYGASAQAAWNTAPRGHGNKLTAGAAYDHSSLDFQQFQQFGYLNPDKSVTPVDAFADGSTSVNGVPYDTRVDLHGVLYTASVYATDTLSLGRAWNLTASGRYNRTTITNADRINPGGGPGSLDGRDVFARFNPSAGVTYSPSSWLNAYFGYSEGSRAPTSVELACADPSQPCKLPNAMAGDPPLDQVVTRTFEAGVRGGQETNLSWSAGWFRASNHNDILFVASEQTGYGYFKNFGETLRQGFELNLSGHFKRLSLGGGYTFLDATYQTAETVNGSSNSANQTAAAGTKGLDGTIQIQPGDRIPLIPRHMFKAYADLQATGKLSVNLGFVAVSSSYARGNENNLSQPDGKYYLGSGIAPGYGVVNLGARYQLQRRIQLFGQINNLLNHHYFTAAQLGATGFTGGGTFIARPFPPVDGNYPIQHATFYAPGAPFQVWGGVRLTF